MNIIQTRNLTKSYGDFTAVSNLNLHVPKGSVYGFVGPNGAGKSTTMKMFLGLTRPSSGAFVIDKMSYPHNRVKILREIGSFIESPAFYGNLTGEENLDIIRKLIGESTNLNQLAKRSNAYGFYRVADECSPAGQQISKLIKQLQDER